MFKVDFGRHRPAPPVVQIQSLGLDNYSFTPDGISAQNVGNVLVSMTSGPAFSGTVSFNGGANDASFQLTNGGVLPCTLQAKSTTGVGSYSDVRLKATQGGISNSPFPVTLATITGSAAGAIATVFALQNTSPTTATGTHGLSWGQGFRSGEIAAGRTLAAAVNSTSPATQLDALRYYGDGSVMHGVVSIIAPSLASNGTTSNVFAGSYTSVAPSGTPVDLSTLSGTGYTLSIAQVFSTASPKGSGLGTVTTDVVALLTSHLADTCSFMGYIDGGNTLHVTSIVSGSIKVNSTAQSKTGHYLSHASVPTETRIKSQSVGTPGSTGTYAFAGLPLANIGSVGTPVAFTSAGYRMFKSGPVVAGIRLEKFITDSFRLVIDLEYYSNGDVRWDLASRNDFVNNATGGMVMYDQTVTENGSTVTGATWVGGALTNSTIATTANNAGRLTVNTAPAFQLDCGCGLTGGTVALPSGTRFIGPNDQGSGSLSTGAGGTGTYYISYNGGASSSPYTVIGIALSQYQVRHDVHWGKTTGTAANDPAHTIIRDMQAFFDARLLSHLDLDMSYGTWPSSLSSYVSTNRAVGGGGGATIGPSGGRLPIEDYDPDWAVGGGDTAFGDKGILQGTVAGWMGMQRLPTVRSDAQYMKYAEIAARRKADAGASAPLHFWDPVNGCFLSVDDYPTAKFITGTASPGPPFNQNPPGRQETGWNTTTSAMPAHMVEFGAAVYLMTGDQFYRDLAHSIGNLAITNLEVTLGGFDSRMVKGDGSTDMVFTLSDEVRAQYWGLRSLLNSDLCSPDNSRPKAYYQKHILNNFAWTDGKLTGTNTNGVWNVNPLPTITAGYWHGVWAYSIPSGEIPEFMQNYGCHILSMAQDQGYANCNSMAEYTFNLPVQAAQPHTGTSYDRWGVGAYALYYWNPAVGPYFTTFGSNNLTSVAPNYSTGPVVDGEKTWGNGNYAENALPALADAVSSSADTTRVRDAMLAYCWFISQNESYALVNNSSPTIGTGFFSDAKLSKRPRLPVGTYGSYIYSNNIFLVPFNTSTTCPGAGAPGRNGATSITGPYLMAAYGLTGSVTFNGSSTYPGLIYCNTSGTNVIVFGSARTWAFGDINTGTLSFQDGVANNNYIRCGSGGVNTVYVDTPTIGSGTTEVDAFRHSTDKFSVKSNLNGNGLTTAAAIFGACTASGTDTLVHLGTGNKSYTLHNTATAGVTNLTSGDFAVH